MLVEHILETYNCEIPYNDMRIVVHRFVRNESDGGLFAPVHMHKDYEFLYVIKGKARVTIEDNEFVVGAGDVYFTKPYVSHSEYSMEDEPVVMFGIECQIDFFHNQKSDIDRNEIQAMEDILKKTYYQSFGGGEEILDLLNKIQKENKEKKFGYNLRSKLMIMECIVRTIQIAASNVIEKKKKNLDYSNSTRASSIKNYIDVNVDKGIDIAAICKYVYLSEKQINRIFLEKYGQTVKQYIIDLKFEIAKKLILTTDDSLEDIALKVGFSGYQQLYRVFERKIGITPKQFREENVSEDSQT